MGPKIISTTWLPTGTTYLMPPYGT